MDTKEITIKATLLAALTLPTAVASAAAVAWQPAFEVTGDTDVRVAGRNIVYAINGGDNNGYGGTGETPSAGPAFDVVVGGQTVSFQGLAGHYGAGSTFGATTYGDLADHLPAATDADVTFGVTSTNGGTATVANVNFAPTTESGARVYAPTGGNASLDTLLNSMIWTDGRAVNASALNIVLNDLLPGTTYQVQLIGAADGRAPRSDTIERSLNTAAVNDGLGNSVSNLSAYQDIDGDGQFHVTSVLGTFTADGTSQALNVVLTNGRNPGISALLLTTAVPEPTAMSAAAIATGTMALRRRNR